MVAPVVEQFKLNFSGRAERLPVIGSLAARIATPGEPAKPWLGLKSYAWAGEVADVDSINVVPALEGKKLTLTAGPAAPIRSSTRTACGCCRAMSANRRRAAAA